MSTERPLPLVGAPGSPYTRKLRAVLRYRRIPYAFVLRGAPEGLALPRPRVELLPQLVLEGPPFLVANAVALAHRAERVECTIDGRPWVQAPCPYQAKCRRWLREARAELAASDRAAVDAILAGTGCERPFADVAA